MPVIDKKTCERGFDKLYPSISKLISDIENADYTKVLLDVIVLSSVAEEVIKNCRGSPTINNENIKTINYIGK